MTGRTNLAVSVLCRTTDDLYDFLTERIGALGDVHTAETVLTLRRIKTLTSVPLVRTCRSPQFGPVVIEGIAGTATGRCQFLR